MAIPSSPMPLYDEKDNIKELGVATKLISLRPRHDWPKNAPITTPIYHTSTYRFEKCEGFLDQIPNGYIYQRINTPNCEELTMVISQIEHGKGTVDFPSGMAAVFNTLMCFLEPGDHIVVQSPTYSGTAYVLGNIFPKQKIEITYIDANADVECYREATKENTKLYFAESICNPTMWYLDVEKLGKIGKDLGILTVVDATFISPINQTPLDYGIDIVLHSCTKYMGGHSDLLAGCATVNDLELYSKLKTWQIFVGACQSAHNSVTLQRSLKTLHIRMERHNENGLEVAKFLEKHPKVAKIHYLGLPSHPQHKMACRTMKGFGGMISFESYSKEDSIKFCESTKIFKLAVSLGGAESLIEHVTSMTHNEKLTTPEERKKIPTTLIRLSVGLEDVKDQIADLQQAFEKIGDHCKKGC